MAVVARKRDPLSERIRERVELTGALDGVNRTYSIPDVQGAIHVPPKRQVKVWHGTRMVQPSEFDVTEASPGVVTAVTLIFAPHSTGKVYADYVTAS